MLQYWGITRAANKPVQEFMSDLNVGLFYDMRGSQAENPVAKLERHQLDTEI
jgi:hypothetical protein